MLLAAGAASAAPLEVVVTGVRNDRGDIRLAVCSKDQFLKETCEHVAVALARPGDVTLRLDVPPGTWAAQAFHDEDRDGKIGTNLLGIPTEGIGFSNDARMTFGPPSYATAAFRLAPTGGRIRFALRYQF